jgi:hypothetical protein
MARYDVKVRVTYFYEVEADSDEEAEKQGWMYEDYAHFAEVDDITISEIEEEDEDEDDEFIGGDEEDE